MIRMTLKYIVKIIILNNFFLIYVTIAWLQSNLVDTYLI